MSASKPSPDPSTELFLDLVRAHDRLLADVVALLRPHGLTRAQYNVLRILRGAGQRGLPCSTIGERLLTRGPDVTRLVDGLVRDGWAKRVRAEQDRRVVLVRLLPAARRLLKRLDAPVQDLHRTQFAHLSPADQKRLRALLPRIAVDDPA